jgi:hypothetical protein
VALVRGVRLAGLRAALACSSAALHFAY